MTQVHKGKKAAAPSFFILNCGRYTPPAAGDTTSGGRWRNLSGFIAADYTRDAHNGSIMYASKSFNDTKLDRRVWYAILFAPLSRSGEKLDFAVRLATMPGRHSGDQVHKVK